MVCRIVNAEYVIRSFPDSETEITLINADVITSNDVRISYRFQSPSIVSLNDQFFRVLQLVRRVAACNPRSIRLFVSYLPYARDEHERHSLSLLGLCLKALGVAELHAIQLHDPNVIQTFQVPLIDHTLEIFWSLMIKEKVLSLYPNESWCIISPDQGGADRVQRIASLCGLSFAVIRKIRKDGEPVACEILGSVEGMNGIVVDDILDTGRTAQNAAALLQAHGAKRLFSCFSHALCSSGWDERIKDFEKVFVTNTFDGIHCVVAHSATVVDVYEKYANQWGVEWSQFLPFNQSERLLG